MEGSASVVRRSSVQRSRSPSNASESSVKSIVPDGLTAPADHKLTVQKCFISMQPWEDVDLKKEALRRSLTAPVVPVSLVLGDEGRLVPADPELHPVCPETGSAYVRNLRSVGSRGHKHDTDCPNRRGRATTATTARHPTSKSTDLAAAAANRPGPPPRRRTAEPPHCAAARVRRRPPPPRTVARPSGCSAAPTAAQCRTS